jgi:hypothetical protein
MERRQMGTGAPYVLDAIIGMGEDPWSCGEYADQWSDAQGMSYARDHGIDLYAENPDFPYNW